MRTDELQRIEDVTANFFFWQGLRWAPIGVALVAGIAFAEQFAATRERRILVLGGSVALGFVMSALAGRYYARAYGRVRALPDLAARRERLKWNVVYPLMLLSLIGDLMWKGPVLLSGPIWAAAIVAYRNSTGRGRAHYFVIAALVATTFFLPLFIEPGRTTVNVFFLVIGAAYAIGGILDHLELRRILRPVVED
jgi:hypothetical protein